MVAHELKHERGPQKAAHGWLCPVCACRLPDQDLPVDCDVCGWEHSVPVQHCGGCAAPVWPGEGDTCATCLVRYHAAKGGK